MSSPRNITSPASGRRSPLIVLRTVDFPEPLGPIRHMILPVSTARSTPLRINPAPYPAITPVRLRMIESSWLCLSGLSVELSIVDCTPSTSTTEVRIEDQRVDLHFGRRTHGDRCTAIEDDHGIAKAHDKLHIVFDTEE